MSDRGKKTWLLLLLLPSKRDHQPAWGKSGVPASSPENRESSQGEVYSPFSLMRSELSADTKLSRCLDNFPMSKISVPRDHLCKGDALWDPDGSVISARAVVHQAQILPQPPLMLRVQFDGEDCSLAVSFLMHMQGGQHRFGSWSWEREELFN